MFTCAPIFKLCSSVSINEFLDQTQTGNMVPRLLPLIISSKTICREHLFKLS